MVRQIFSDGETVSPPAVNRELLVRIQFGEPYQDIVFNGSTYALGVYRQGSNPCILTKWHCSSMVEQLAVNQCDVGSNPIFPSNLFLSYRSKIMANFKSNKNNKK